MKQGQHLLIDAFNCNAEKINNKKLIRIFLKDLVEKIHMEILANPKVYSAALKQPGGKTGFVIITTSHISIHTFTDGNYFWLDVLSCKPFNIDVVVKAIEKEFECEIESQTIMRKTKKS